MAAQKLISSWSILALCGLLLGACSHQHLNKAENNLNKSRLESPKKLEVFVMSQCPFGVMALNSVKEVIENFKGAINLDVHFIAVIGDDGSTIYSMHGPAEVEEDIRQLCVIRHYRDNYQFLDYILCRNKNIRDTNWQACTGENGIDTKMIEDCAVSDEGMKLLREDINIAQELGIRASPTWLVNNRYLFSGIDAETIKVNYCAVNRGLNGCENKLSGPTDDQPSGGCGVR
jgi:hypothetical protein